MTNLAKLDKTIDELETYSTQMKSVSAALLEIQQLFQAIENTNSDQQKINSIVQQILSKLHETNQDLVDRYQDFSQKQTTLNENFKKGLASLNTSNKKAFEEMREKVEELNHIQNDINHQLIENVKLVSSENTKLYLDQKKFIESQLDLQLNEVKVLSGKTREMVYEEIKKLENKSVQLENKISYQEELHTKQIKTIKLLIWLSLGISLVNVVLRFV